MPEARVRGPDDRRRGEGTVSGYDPWIDGDCEVCGEPYGDCACEDVACVQCGGPEGECDCRRCTCRYCYCCNRTEAGEVCRECLDGAHQG